jgi:ketosteroid isomerase-like protein
MACLDLRPKAMSSGSGGGVVRKADGVALVRRYFKAVVAGDLDAFDRVFATDFVNHRPDGNFDTGPDGMRQFVRAVLEWIPDLSVEVQDLFAHADVVGARITLSGTAAATGTPVSLTEIQLYRIANNRIARSEER